MGYEVSNIHKSYGDLKVLDDVSIKFEKNMTTCILGPSGCGKTTLLNIISGMLPADKGKVIGFENENIGFVFQEDRLIPWKSVYDNIDFVIRGKIDKKNRREIINKYLNLVGLEYYKDYYPNSLSGGMKQRISILRAFIYPSEILIMDEPFKSLDINTKEVVTKFFLNLKKSRDKTCIIVTHDIEEAAILGDNITIFTQKPTKVQRIIKNRLSLEDRIKNKEELDKLKKTIEGEFVF
ncbi:ABC transporter ATP-binding protein [Acidilutibacter cellobiosedens]|uniref:ABC transporter ATP-binding protein n=1 Tax=Acidilutibacter cellobiosedens TaxID=2507161 RepID=A0A410QH21_9FIRM|nr:ABC transporter ATP-binding protein [Acidilutibacter cellobiosedens]MBE6081133.1 ABC transporter ATP-binding protein [Tissierellaceae bacterium]QAT63158.1 ABC transporter ATP-binding protein [Acidilutibacter cellobiosedens]